MTEVQVMDMARASWGMRVFGTIGISIVAIMIVWIVKEARRVCAAQRKKNGKLDRSDLLGIIGTMGVALVCVAGGWAIYHTSFNLLPREGKWTKAITVIETEEPLTLDELTLKAHDSLVEVADKIEGDLTRWEITIKTKEKDDDSRNP